MIGGKAIKKLIVKPMKEMCLKAYRAGRDDTVEDDYNEEKFCDEIDEEIDKSF